jgi:hypothetical protein
MLQPLTSHMRERVVQPRPYAPRLAKRTIHTGTISPRSQRQYRASALGERTVQKNPDSIHSEKRADQHAAVGDQRKLLPGPTPIRGSLTS